jgi:predicted transcriptional regulator of viral defense system
LLKITIIRNNISYISFKDNLSLFKIISIEDIRKIYPNFDSRRLIEWQQKGYLVKLINKWYLFSDVPVNENLLFRISNCLYHPSYLSLESALSFHHLIPEAVYSPQAITTLKSKVYETPVGSFRYRRIKPELFFGYQVLHLDGLPVLMADREKAILDYLYFRAGKTTEAEIEALRLNAYELKQTLDKQKLEQYLAVYASPTLERRIQILNKLISHANAT